MVSFRKLGRAERTPASSNWYIAETFWTFLGGRIGCCFASTHPGKKLVYREHDEEVDGRSNQKK